MEKIETENTKIVNEIIEKLKGKNYATITAILNSVKDEIDVSLILN